MYLYMNSKNEFPSPLIELFTRNTDIHNYNTRHSKDVHIHTPINSFDGFFHTHK